MNPWGWNPGTETHRVLISYESYFSRIVLLMDKLVCGENEKNYVSAQNPNYFVKKTPVAIAWNAAV